LRKHFEISPESIVAATLSRLSREKKFDARKAQKAFDELGINPEKLDPARA
jgi:pyruvate dehydrogenase E1 component